MITGFNTDVQFNGKTYHVQTEDRGTDNPVLETLVYVKGQILDSQKTSYRELFKTGPDEKRLAGMLEAQHKRIIRSIKNGRYDPDGIKPFGHGLLSDRSLDEVILGFLEEQAAAEKVEMQVEELGDLRPGWTGALRVTLRTDILARPVSDCDVRITWEAPAAEKPARLFHGRTDPKGILLAEVTLPELASRGEVRIAATLPHGEQEVRLPLPRP